MNQDMVSRSLSETLKLYSASQISWGPCYKADYDPESLGTVTQLDLGCVLKVFLNKLPHRADVKGPQTTLRAASISTPCGSTFILHVSRGWQEG